jgi:RNA polymerase sigma-70 factor, ECF subfamily
MVIGRRTARAVRCDSSDVDQGMCAQAEDVALLRSVAAGDERALADLYDRHAGWLLVRMSRRCASADLVDQALQDTFLALWRQAVRYRGEGDVGAFIWGIGVRRLIDAIRRDSTLTRAARVTWLHAADAELVRSAEEEVLLGIEHGRLGAALASLSPELRAAMQATVLDGLTCAEAGRLLGVPAGTIKSRCHRARIELREALA